jgi:hypothetical protein
MVEKRKKWANDHISKGIEFWSNVCFTDESMFKIMEENVQFVRRRPGEEFKKECVVQTVKHPTQVMVWSVFSTFGPGRLYIVEGTMNQHQYRRVLETRLIPQIKEWYPEGGAILLHDGAPCHRAKSISKFLEEEKIDVMEWPGNSPDLNPIENLWAIVKRRIADRFPTTKQALIESLIDVWNHDQEVKDICTRMVVGMPRRVKAVVEAKGGSTKY